MVPKRLAILGDSWAHGEWSFVGDSNLITHPGLSHFLYQKYPDVEIVNFAISGGRNLYQLDKLNEYNMSEFDAVIVFWTDPGRDVINELEQDPINRGKLTETIYKNKCKRYTLNNLDGLQLLGIPVLMIGGHVSLPDQVNDEKYTNITPVIDRMTNLVKHPFWSLEHMTHAQGTVHNKIDWKALTRWSGKGFSELFWKDVQRLSRIDDKMLNLEYFNDLGHANRQLHEIASVKIIEQLEQCK